MDNDKSFYLLIAGSRTFNDYECLCAETEKLLANKIKQGYSITIVSGGAAGADKMAEQFADENEYKKMVFAASWKSSTGSIDESAGYKRNNTMHLFLGGLAPDSRGCLCFWDGESEGTKHNFGLALKKKTPIRVYNYKENRYLSKKELLDIVGEEG